MIPTTRNLLMLPQGEHRDPAVPGFVVRVAPGGRFYELRYTRAGKRHRLRIGDSRLLGLAAAREEAKRILSTSKVGTDPRVAAGKREGATIAEVGREYFAWSERTRSVRPQTRAERQRVWGVDVEPALGDVLAESLSRAQIRAWGEARGGWPANKAFELLRTVYNWAIGRDMITANPFHRLEKPFSGEAPRERYLSVEEIRALGAALEEIPCGFSNAIHILMLTGVRRSSVLSARVSDIDEGAALWSIPAEATKSGRAHDVPLSTQALAVFRAQRELIDGPDLFPVLRGGARVGPRQIGSRYIRSLRARMNRHLGREAEQWTVHDIRRTVATHMEDALGIRREVVSAILSHSLGSAQTLIYSRSQLLAERRAALQAWADWVAWPQGGPSGFPAAE